MQMVEIRAQVVEMPAPAPAGTAPPSAPARGGPKLFSGLRKLELMAFGVPEEWVDDVRAATEDTLFEVIAHLPQEAGEALLELAVGSTPAPPPPVPAEADPFAHPDARRRFRVMADAEDLQRALDAPWETWAVFLHPAQAALVERRFGGPVRVSGSAGTGKTIVAIHRAVHLTRATADARVLLTTFSKTLAAGLKRRLDLLTAGDAAVAARITVKPLAAVVYDLHRQWFGARTSPRRPSCARSSAPRRRSAARAASPRPSRRRVDRRGRRLAARQLRGLSRRAASRPQDAPRRQAAGGALGRLRARPGGLAARNLTTSAGMFARVTARLADGGKSPFSVAVVDEAQDLGVPEARFLAAAVGTGGDALFLAGDLGQRIFQQPFSWKALGLDVRGRSFSLRICYRTSHQIRAAADRLLPGAIADVDGIAEQRKGTVSVFDGPAPEVVTFDDAAMEAEMVGDWLAARVAEGFSPAEIGIIVRSEAQLARARAAAKRAGLATADLGDAASPEPGRIAVATMHLAKGLEFRAVAVIACDDEVIPLQERVERARRRDRPR